MGRNRVGLSLQSFPARCSTESSHPTTQTCSLPQQTSREYVPFSINLTNLVHTREADTDILKILTENVPRETHMHIHCFTDSPSLAASILSHFPNSFIGITGVITYSSNLNTTEVVKATPLERLLLETDSPFMVPNNVQKGIKSMGGKSTRIPVCWSGMIPYTAEWVADIKGVSAEKVLDVTRENAVRMYGIEV